MRSHCRMPVIACLACMLLCACGGPQSVPAGPGFADPLEWSYAAVDWTDPQSRPQPPQAEPATFHSLGVRWPVQGDANHNARIRVDYRTQGAPQWIEGLPLFRTAPGHLPPELKVESGWLFAGSLFHLQPGTPYQLRLTLTDPDGGDQVETLSMRTREEPQTPQGMRLRHVIPATPGGTGNGSADDPYSGLKIAQATAQPGDLFLLHAGVYNVGRWTVDRHGTPGRPIIYRAAGDGEVILDGLGDSRLISANGLRHVWFEGLVLRNADYLLVGHEGSDLVVRGCRFEVKRVGVTAINGGYDVSRGFVITDNGFRGPSSWPRSKGIEGTHAVSVTGAGHVIAFNRMHGFGDAIHGTQHGRLSSSDIYNNDIYNCTDDGIEADHSTTNIRVFNNRVTNAFSAVTAQPVKGGPVYVWRNAIYNVQYSPFKLHNNTSGLMIYHNTSISSGIGFNIQPGGDPVNDVVTRNNLFIANGDYGLRTTTTMNRCDFDNDGYGGFRGWLGGVPFAVWEGETYSTTRSAGKSGKLYAKHGAIELEPDRLFDPPVRQPDDYMESYPASINRPLLAKDGAAIDRAVPLPNINVDFSGEAPDLGCCEFGKPLPDYGPRPGRLPAEGRTRAD